MQLLNVTLAVYTANRIMCDGSSVSLRTFSSKYVSRLREQYTYTQRHNAAAISRLVDGKEHCRE